MALQVPSVYETSCGVRGCDARFTVPIGLEKGDPGGALYLDKRAIFAVCRRHEKWMRENGGPELDTGAGIPGTWALRAGPMAARWLHDHCMPTLTCEGGRQSEDAEWPAIEAACRRFPASTGLENAADEVWRRMVQ